MNKKDIIAREILGWKTYNRDSWYDVEQNEFIHKSYFDPEKYIEHASLIVKKLDMFGVTYKTNGESVVRFDAVTGIGDTLPEAITNAACSFIENYYSTFNKLKGFTI